MRYEAVQGRVLGAVDFQDLGQADDLKDHEDLLGNLGQLDLPAQVLDGHVAGQDFADAEAVDEIDAFEIEQDVPPPFVQLLLDQVMEGRFGDVGAADRSPDVENDDIAADPRLNIDGVLLSPMFLAKDSGQVNSKSGGCCR